MSEHNERMQECAIFSLDLATPGSCDLSAEVLN